MSSLRSRSDALARRRYRGLRRLIVLDLISILFAALHVLFRNRVDTSLEIHALRQQLAVLKRKRTRPSLNRLDRFFWTSLRHIWPRWSDVTVPTLTTPLLLLRDRA